MGLTSFTLLHLDLCRNLVELDLEYVGSEVAAFESNKLELPRLKDLGLRSSSDLSSNHFKFLSFPQLADFRVFSILAEPEPSGSFLHILRRHCKSLRRPTIGHIHFMYFQTSRPETRTDFTSFPFAQLLRLGYLQLYCPPLDKPSAFLKAISLYIPAISPSHSAYCLQRRHTTTPFLYTRPLRIASSSYYLV